MFWIKLYVDFLEDFKLGPVPEYLQLRFIKLLLVAAEFDKSGLLPSVTRIAWRLRLGDGEIGASKARETLSALREVGVVDETPTGWVITNWEKRQAALTNAERVKQFRDRKRNEKLLQRYGASSGSDSFDKEESLKSSALKDKEFSEISTLYSNEIGELTRMSSDILTDAIEDYTADWIKSAIAEAVRQNARSWAYVEAILTRWKRDGFQSKKSREAAAPDTAWINVTELRLAEEAKDA